MQRCFGGENPVYQAYHDNEWGRHGLAIDDQGHVVLPEGEALVAYDRHLFELLTLEGAQAGLSWETVLMKREGYRAAFYSYDLERVATMSDEQLDTLRNNSAIIRNRLKIASVPKNARVVLAIAQQYGSFAAYLWQWVDGVPQVLRPQSAADVPAHTPLSDAISRDLKKRGMSFVGMTIIYAYLQAVGVTNDHMRGCFLYPQS